jgi:hypothetical protein
MAMEEGLWLFLPSLAPFLKLRPLKVHGLRAFSFRGHRFQKDRPRALHPTPSSPFLDERHTQEPHLMD